MSYVEIDNRVKQMHINNKLEEPGWELSQLTVLGTIINTASAIY